MQGKRYRKGGAAVEFRVDRHGSSEPAHQGAHMGKTDALAGLVLRAGTPEQFENALVILLIDAAPVIGDLENGKAELGASLDGDGTGNARFQILDRIVDQIGKDLLQRKTVAHDIWQVPDLDSCLSFRSLMRERRDNGLDQLTHVDRHRVELAPALPGEVEDRRDEA